MPVDGVIKIRGRSYNTVAKRVNDFRRVYGIADGWGLLTAIESIDAERVVMRAEVMSPDGRLVAVGHAEEVRSASKINQTSALENCESSAIGRALAAAGFGGSEYASADEVTRAIQAQEAREVAQAKEHAERMQAVRKWSDRERGAFCARIGELGHDYGRVAAYCESIGRPRPSVMNAGQRKGLLQWLSEKDRTDEVAAATEEGA